jgi:N-acyl-D-aspartate/D-glutamate deacylase
MSYDLLFRGGRIVDGSGLPSYSGDVAIKDGKIAEIGRIRASVAKTIDVDGLVVAPGFIDHHTHMDGQIQWDPYATSEPEHGITSIVMGNCGLALAPVKSGDEEDLVKSFVRVEAIPRSVLEQGLRWDWRSYGEYLDRLEGRLGINVGGLVGHIAVRQYVLGDAATERAATAEEIQRMKQVVGEAMAGGAIGFSTNRNDRHMREDGKPVPSRLAEDVELFQLCDALGELSAGVIQINEGQVKIAKHFALYAELARRTQRPIVWQILRYIPSRPNLWKEQLDAVAPIFQSGQRAYGACSTMPTVRRFTLKNTQVFDEFPTWKNVMCLPVEARKQALGDPETRAKFRADFTDPRPTLFHRRWELVKVEKVVKPDNEKYLGKSIAEVAVMSGEEQLDAFLNLALGEDLETSFQNANTGGDQQAMAEILRSPYVLIGNSDAGAHVQYGAQFGYGTTLLGLWVRERGVMSLEQAIHKLTAEVASVYGIPNRGSLQPGYAADLAIFEPGKIKSCEPEWAQDYPGGTKRLIQHAIGMHYTVVNGRVICADGRLSGDLPGEVLRTPAYIGHSVAADS